MSSTTRLLVLGVVRIFQSVHGYEVRRELVSWRAQEWASVKPGSIYNALKTLTRDGYLEVVGTDQVGGRPERTTYRLTAAGEEEFRILLREEWWTVRPTIDPLMAAISFITFVTRDEAIAALEHRTAQIHGMVRHLELGIDAHDGTDSPYHVREMMRLMNARVLSEVAWAQQLLERLRNGEYSTAADPPWQPPRAPAKGKPAQRSRRRAAGPAAIGGTAAIGRTVPTGPTSRPSRAARPRGEPAVAARPTTGRDRDRRREPAERTRDLELGARRPRPHAVRRKPPR